MMTAPCSLNTEPYLCEWHADLQSGMEIWIQTSEDESKPKWVRLGSLYEWIWMNTYRSEFEQHSPMDITMIEDIAYYLKQPKATL